MVGVTLEFQLFIPSCMGNMAITLKEETFAEETFAISRFLAKFAKYLLSINRESLFSRKKKSFRLAKVKKPKNLYIP